MTIYLELLHNGEIHSLGHTESVPFIPREGERVRFKHRGWKVREVRWNLDDRSILIRLDPWEHND